MQIRDVLTEDERNEPSRRNEMSLKFCEKAEKQGCLLRNPK